MVFNPRTESNSYVMLAPVIALPAAALLSVWDRPRLAGWLYLLSFMLICDAWAYRQTENWLKPLTCFVVWYLLIRALLRYPPHARINRSWEADGDDQSRAVATAASSISI